MRKKNYGLYTFDAVEEFIDRMVNEEGYDAEQTDEGCLGIGDWTLYPPTDDRPVYKITEEYLNEWSSAQRIVEYR